MSRQRSPEPIWRTQRPAPRLGIAIVHYHAETLLAECLRRLRASHMADFRVHLVDCGSRDGLDRCVPADERFEVITAGRNIGFAAGTNLALERFSDETPLLLCLNPDVLVEPDTLGRVIRTLEEDPARGAVTCQLLLPSGSLDPACRRSDPTVFSAFSKHAGLQTLFPRSRLFGSYNLTHLDPALPHEIDCGTCAFLLIRREALQAAGGGLDERFFLYGEDLDLCLRLRRAGYHILYTPSAQATHVKGSGRIRSLHTTGQFYKAMWTYYRKWGHFRSNPLVLGPLLVSLLVLGTIEVVRNSIRILFAKLASKARP